MKTTLLIDSQQWAIERLQSLGARIGKPRSIAPHLALGLEGERDALFQLRREGYTIVARRWSSSRMRGDIDLIGWDKDWLCFIEVKTRSARSSMAPAETAVDHDKQRMLRRLAHAYLRTFPEEKRRHIPVRFDVVSVYVSGAGPQFELFRGAFGWT